MVLFLIALHIIELQETINQLKILYNPKLIYLLSYYLRS